MESQPIPQTSKQNISMATVLLLGAALLCAILLAGGAIFYYNGPCGISRTETAIHLLSDKFQEFNDAYDIASSTPRIGLAGPVTSMQTIQRETEKIDVPACMAAAKEELVQSMDVGVAGFLAFMSQQSDIEVSRLMTESVGHMGAFNDELLAVRECRPFCR